MTILSEKIIQSARIVEHNRSRNRCAPGRRSYHTEMSVPRGVFCLLPSGKSGNSTVFDNPDVDGISIRQAWEQMNPADGIYDWTYLDGQIDRATAAGKMISLRIGTGSGGATDSGGNVPDWVMALVTKTFQFIDTNSGGITRTIPAFWDTAFKRKKNKMIAALGARYASNENIKIVFVGFANAQSTDWSVPDSTTVDGLGASGSSERSRWLSLGYTAQKLINAGCPASGTTGVIDAAARAFPNATIAYAVGRASAAEDAPSMNGLDPTKDYIAQTVLDNTMAKYGNRIAIQKNSLSQKTADNQPYSAQPADNQWTIIYNNPTCVGAQMLWNCFGDAAYRMNGGVGADPATVLMAAVDTGVAYNTQYQEIYQTDVINLAEVISYAHNVLA
jgi:glycosyl hydrolase family 42 (putative beta-galactosidase)